jgi:ribonuclease PH
LHRVVETSLPPWLRGKVKGLGGRPNMACCRARPIRAAGARPLPASNPAALRKSSADRRSLRAVVDLEKLGERQITLDCDVIQADGGTRTAAISGAWVALRIAVDKAIAAGQIEVDPIRGKVAAVSCGIMAARRCSISITSKIPRAGADGNFVLTDAGNIVEAQVTAEGETYDEEGPAAACCGWRGSVAPRSSPRRTGRPADDAAFGARQAGHRQPQSRQDPGDRRTARPARHRARLRDRPRSAGAGGDRHHLRRQCDAEGARCGGPQRPARHRRRQRPVRRCAGRPSGHLFGALGRALARAGAGRRSGEAQVERDFGYAMQRVHDELVALGPDLARNAHFVCALAVCWPEDGQAQVFEGRVDGLLVWPPRGKKGFGYDAMFQPIGYDQTFGEMEPARSTP